jgi:hypothetical protein
MIVAERAGYIQQTSGVLAMLSVKPGEHLTDYKITMALRALIVGHVVDEYGDPVQNVNVQVQPLASNRTQGFAYGQGNTMTDDRGEFRILTGPGKYYLKASEMRGYGGPAEIRTDGTAGGPFIPTFYPSAATAGAASVVEVAAGQDLTGIEIRLLRSGAGPASRTFTISGTVTGIPENGSANVMLRFGEAAGQYHTGSGGNTEADGTFKFTGMQPGYYSVAASYSSGKTPLQSRAVEFHLESADQTGLALTLSPGEELTGKLELVGDASVGEAQKHTVRLEAAGWGYQFGQGAPPAAEVDKDGSFQIAAVTPGKFKPVVEPMPENGYLKAVALDGKAVPDSVLDFTQGVGGSRLKITVSRNGGQISGRVLGKDGEPAIGMTMVLMGADAKHMGEENSARTTDGKYSLKALRPGKYRIVAIDLVAMMQASNGDGDNDERAQQLFDASEEIEVKEGDRIAKDLSVLTKLPEKKEPQ